MGDRLYRAVRPFAEPRTDPARPDAPDSGEPACTDPGTVVAGLDVRRFAFSRPFLDPALTQRALTFGRDPTLRALHQGEVMSNEASQFGRVDTDGTVYVRTADGDRAVGQWPDADPEAALAFYQQRYDGLVVEVDLLEKRIRSGALSPDDATAAVAKTRKNVAEAQAVGDLDRLLTRLEQFGQLIEERRAVRRAERAEQRAVAEKEKRAIAAEAERVAEGNDWRGGANRMRELLARWKGLARIDKPTDEELWHRFSSARTTYTRRRKQHFADLGAKREEARRIKERLVTEAEAVADSTDWGATSRLYRDLMRQWKAAGGAPKSVDDALWKRFRGAQDRFFTARDEHNAVVDKEYAANAEVKRGLLAEAEQLLPVQDPKAARRAFREIAEKWDAAGKVPRGEIKDLEGRFSKIERTISASEDARWQKTSPEAQARAADTVAKLESMLDSLRADLTSAEQAGDTRRAEQVRADITARQEWLDHARRALDDLTPG